MKANNSQISLHASGVAETLGLVALLLMSASLGAQYMKYFQGYDTLKGLSRLFSLAEEHNIPTLFSVSLLLSAAILLSFIYKMERQNDSPHSSKWAILSFGFLLMAFDEGCQLHELLMAPAKKMLWAGDLGYLHFAWVVPAFGIVFFVGMFFLRFLCFLPAPVRIRFLVSAAVYLAGAIGMELIGGKYASMNGSNTWDYSVIVAIEETLEMGGAIIFVRALLIYCAENYKSITFKID